MRRKNRKWVAMAAALYLFVMWSAYRWSVAQRPPDGNILLHMEREAIRKAMAERAKEAANQPQPTGEPHLSAAGPAYVAARYDAKHVVFMVVAETESRFSASQARSGTPVRFPAPPKAVSPLAGFHELWEPDSHSLHFFSEIVQKTQPGERWNLDLLPGATIPVVIERPVIAPTGCSLALGFLASVPPDQQAMFSSSTKEYFVVRRTLVEPVDNPLPSHIAELLDWKPSSTAAEQIQQQLNERMQQEVAKIDASLLANAASPGASIAQSPVGNARPRTKEWIRADRGLTRGEGILDYDVRAFRLTPDGDPRLFVRARWKLADAVVFLMTAWFRQGALSSSQPALLSSDASWSTALREGDPTGALGERLDFQTILNEFDADHDGWAELLVHADRGYQTTITLYLYTDLGLVPLKAPLHRDAQPPESCVDP